MRALEVLEVGPGVSVQDRGRFGFIGLGLSRGGAADPVGLAEGAALLGQPVGAALELPGYGGRFTATEDVRIALSGAPMRAEINGNAVCWHASYALPAGAVLRIAGVQQGVYGYLTVGGGFDLTPRLGAVSAHLASGIGRALRAGDRLALHADPGGPVNTKIAAEARWTGGTLRVLPSLQTGLFSPAEQARFENTCFARDPRGNRMGVRLTPEGAGFALGGGLSIVSEVISPGDIQIPGEGTPFILLNECQTTGGYPRIGTVIPADLPRVAQAGPGAQIRFAFVSRDAALAAERAYRDGLNALPRRVSPMFRDPAAMPDLSSYNLISGVTAGEEP